MITAEEVFALCGIKHITLSAAALALIQHTELDERFEGIRDRSLRYLQEEHEVDTSSPFFSHQPLAQVLQDPAVADLQSEALMYFEKAEEELRELALQHL